MTKQMLTWNHEPEIFILKFGITTSKSQIVNLKSQIITQAHRLVHPDKIKFSITSPQCFNITGKRSSSSEDHSPNT